MKSRSSREILSLLVDSFIFNTIIHEVSSFGNSIINIFNYQVPPVQNAEPGWMAGEIRGHTGWFPESYVEPIEPLEAEPVVADPFVHQDSLEKRTLELVLINTAKFLLCNSY